MYDLVYIDRTADHVTTVPNHNHVLWELFYVRTGTGVYCNRGKEYPFSPGSIVISRPGELHYERSPEGYGNYYMFFRSFFMTEDMPFYMLRDIEGHYVRSLIEILISLEDSESNQSLRSAVFEALHQVIRSLIPSQQLNVHVEKLKHEIEENFRDPGYSQNASASLFCPDHIRRLFIRDVGTTPHQYLISLRVNYAKQLINDRDCSQLTLKEIAFRAGYSDYYYFSRQFKQHTGFSPKEWSKISPYTDRQPLK